MQSTLGRSKNQLLEIYMQVTQCFKRLGCHDVFDAQADMLAQLHHTISCSGSLTSIADL